MNAGKLYEGCRQWPLWEALRARLEASPDGRGAMTSLEAVQCLLEAGTVTVDVRDDLATVRKGAPGYGYELLPAKCDPEGPAYEPEAICKGQEMLFMEGLEEVPE